MNAIYVEAQNLQKLTDVFTAISTNKEVASVLFFMATKNAYSSKELTPLLSAFPKPLTGGVFSGLVYNGAPKKQGVLFMLLPEVTKSIVLPLAESKKAHEAKIIAAFADEKIVKSTVFLAFDGYSKLASAMAETVYDFFGTDVKYFGGGAVPPDDASMASIITNEGLQKNAAVVTYIPSEKQLGAAHGLHAISTPLKVTKTEGQKVISINGKPPFVLYKKIVERFSGKAFTKKNQLELLNTYPLGVLKLDAEPLVRDIVKLEDTALITQNGVTEGEHVLVMDAATDQTQIAASLARKKAFPWAANAKKSAFCIVSNSRYIVMPKNVEKELAVLQDKGTLHGLFTQGEIMNPGDALVEIGNKLLGVVKW